MQPIWDRRCVQCHGREKPAAGLELTGDITDMFNVSYDRLVREGSRSESHYGHGLSTGATSRRTALISTYNGSEQNILQIEPGAWGAKASLLAKLVESGHPDANGKPRTHLTQEEKLKVYLWLDLNVPYYPESRRICELAGAGYRQVLPPQWDQTVREIASRRCASCHDVLNKKSKKVIWNQFPKSWSIRLDHPELNPILKAPLAKTAAGGEHPGGEVFKTKDDPDYRKLLDSLIKLRKQLQDHPRLDMLSTNKTVSFKCDAINDKE